MSAVRQQDLHEPVMLLESPALTNALKGSDRARCTADRAGLSSVRNDEDVADHLQRLVDRAQQLALRGPLAVTEVELLGFAVCHLVGDVLVVSEGLSEERIARQVLDQIEQQAPATCAPELA